jgi:hypothetical protein
MDRGEMAVRAERQFTEACASGTRAFCIWIDALFLQRCRSCSLRFVWPGALRDLMISSFDNQRASSPQANAIKRGLNAPKR